MKLEIITKDPIGDRKPTEIVCVHSFFTSAWIWDQGFMDYFANRGYRIHALSLRGHGRSEGRDNWRWWGVQDFVEDLQDFYAGFRGRPVLIGASAGAFYLQKLLENHRPPAAVLLAPVPYSGLTGTAAEVFNSHPVLFLKILLSMDPRKLVSSKALCREFLFSEDLPAEELVQYCRKFERESFRAFLEIGLFSRANPGKVDSPVLVVGSETDGLVSPGATRKTARKLNAELEMLPGIGHMMVLDRGWEAAARRINKFLTDQGL